MKKIFGSLIIAITIFSYCFAQEGSGSLPPPVDIKVSVGNIYRVGEEAKIKIKVTPQEDIHADISCLLPYGIEPVREKAVTTRPYRSREPDNMQRETRYIEAVNLWVGPLKGGRSKEFAFSIIIPDKERYAFIARVEALAKWGIKEETFVIDIIN